MERAASGALRGRAAQRARGRAFAAGISVRWGAIETQRATAPPLGAIHKFRIAKIFSVYENAFSDAPRQRHDMTHPYVSIAEPERGARPDAVCRGKFCAKIARPMMIDIFNHFMPQAYLERLGSLIRAIRCSCVPADQTAYGTSTRDTRAARRSFPARSMCCRSRQPAAGVDRSTGQGAGSGADGERSPGRDLP